MYLWPSRQNLRHSKAFLSRIPWCLLLRFSIHAHRRPKAAESPSPPLALRHRYRFHDCPQRKRKCPRKYLALLRGRPTARSIILRSKPLTKSPRLNIRSSKSNLSVKLATFRNGFRTTVTRNHSNKRLAGMVLKVS